MNARTPRRQSGFSMVEVVLAVGIFSFAILAILALFGGVNKNTRSLVDRDATAAAWQSLSAAIATNPAAVIEAVPAGTSPSLRPELFARVVRAGSALGMEVRPAPTGFTSTSDERLYRARLYRALTASGEAAWAGGRAYYPLRVVVDVFPAGGYNPTNLPMESTAFNFVWNAR